MELVEAKRDVLSAPRMMGLCQTIHRTTYTATSGGSTSLSLALRSAWAMADMFAAVMGVQGDGPGSHDGASSPHRGPRSKPRASPPTPHTAPLAGKRSGGQGGGSREKAKRTGRHADKVGEVGPNGLPRMAGGNPRGQPCKGHARGNCRFETCSFSHA